MPSPKRVPLSEENTFYKHVSVENISMLNIEDIEPDPGQPRKQFDEQSIKELADSIKEKGLLQPIIVRKVDDKYLIVAGERRYRACKLLGMEKVPCIVKALRDPKDILEIQIIENMQREDISQIERAKALQEYLSLELGISKNDVLRVVADSLFGKVDEDTAQKIAKACTILGKSARTIYRWLMLLTLPEDIQQKIDDPNSPLTAKHVEVLASIEDEQLIRHVAELIEKENLSSSEAKDIVEQLQKEPEHGNGAEAPSVLDPVIKKVKSLKKRIPKIADDEEKEQIRQSLIELRNLVDALLEEL